MPPTSHDDVIHAIRRVLISNHARIEDLVEALYTRLVSPGDICVDGGANVGRHTLPLARLVGSTGVVHAFEPMRKNLATLEDRLASAGASNVIVHPRALTSEHDQLRTFFGVENLPEEGSLRKKKHYTHAPELEELRVATATIDAVFADADRLRFLKLDLEGGELDCLRGGIRTLGRFRPAIILEHSPDAALAFEYSPRDFFELFAECGYLLHDILGQPYSEKSWDDPSMFWYLIAVTEGSADHAFVERELRAVLESTLQSWVLDASTHTSDTSIAPGDSFEFNTTSPGRRLGPASLVGFSSMEPLGTWTDGPSASLMLSTQYRNTLLIRFRICMTLLAGQELTVRILVNETLVDVWKFDRFFSQSIDKCIVIDESVIAILEGRLRLRFAVENPASPQRLGFSEDERQLGILLQRMSIHSLGEGGE